MRRQSGYAFLLVFLLLATQFLGCSDNECGPTCRRDVPTLDNIWPNENGTHWTYDYTWRSWDTTPPIYPDTVSLPHPPSLDEIEDILGRHAIGSNPDIVKGTYRLEFDGLTTTESGVTAQNLEETVDAATAFTGQGARGLRCGSFLERLRVARPDLRVKLDARYPGLGADLLSQTPPGPIMLHGGAWEKTEGWIGTYGDLDTLLAWKYLEADLAKRHEFTHQLIPSLTDDVFLHCRVLGWAFVSSVDGCSAGAVECLYMVDYGKFQSTEPGGNPIGWQRFYDYGRVFYIPGTGPVSSYERTLVSVGEALQPGYGDIEVVLSGTNANER